MSNDAFRRTGNQDEFSDRGSAGTGGAEDEGSFIVRKRKRPPCMGREGSLRGVRW